ncbi:MAG: MAPEG family protein [Rhizobiaceae bacterium]|nr:MAPEG family protein [Rhizobiaceae bacterium]
MSGTAIFWPMLVQVALVYVIYALISRNRIRAVKSGNAKSSQFRENQVEPPESLFYRNNLANQFELPVLFYAACISLFVTGGASTVPVVLAWLFALSRIAHAVIHVTSNRLRYRRPVFTLGYLFLAVMWVWFALHLAGVI